MKIFVPKETHPGEKRVPIIPDSIRKLVKRGAQIEVESGIGETINLSDEDYTKEGAEVSSDRNSSSSSAHISFLDPFNEPELINEFVNAGVSAISMEMIPRTTLAQKMDALSSQANLSGYVTVIIAAERLDKILPMMMTPAGTISPARVFVIGVGVAGLQAIATAKRLGARVEAFDTRPVVEEQVQSLGAKFITIDLGETGETKDGYAKELTPEQLQRQREGMAKVCAQSDIVITTAQVFGRKAPLIVSSDMITGMTPGSVIVDMAVESGGNVEGSKVDEEVEVNGVRIIGLGNLPGLVAFNASQMYSANLCNMLEHFWDDETKSFRLDLEDEIIAGCLITHENQIVNEVIRNLSQ
jgi:NAD(P) transhydrogenase subunit alpha